MDTTALTDQILALESDAKALRAFLGALEREEAARLATTSLTACLTSGRRWTRSRRVKRVDYSCANSSAQASRSGSWSAK